MATPRRLNFSSDDSHTSNAAADEEEETSKKTKTMKKKKKLGSPVIKRIWNEDDEVAILKGLADYRVKTRHNQSFDWDGFFCFVRGSIVAEFSKEQLFSLVKKLKKSFLVHMERISQRNDPLFTRCTDSQAFGYAKMIWGQEEEEAEAELANGGMEKDMQTENVEEAFKENEQVGNNAEPVNGNVAEKSKFDGKPIQEVGVEKTNEDKTDGKESHDGDGDDDEVCVVRDAFETMVSRGLSGYQKMVQLEKLMNLGTEKRKELSDEWKALCAEEVKLNIKRLRFSVKLVEAANDV